jgi:molecular chaperone DnaK
MFLRSEEPTAAIGQRVEITVDLPTGSAVIEGVVRHIVSREIAAVKRTPAGIGIEVTARCRTEMAALAEIARLRQGKIAEPAEQSSAELSRRMTASFPTGPAADIVGFDFGVSYSGVSAAIGEKVHMIPDAKGRVLHPSILAYPEGKRPLFGWPARRFQGERPDWAVASVKRLLGHRYSDVAVGGFLQSQPYRTSAGPEDAILVHLHEDTYPVQQLCAEVLSRLRELAEAQIGRPIKRAVLNSPVGFDHVRRAALTRAAKMAGLESVAVIEEPLAAALAYGHGRGRNEIVAVYDFGGGTFDFTVLDMSADHYRVLISDGDSWLGGDDFDEAIANGVANAFWRRTGVELQGRLIEWQRLLLACELAKRQLSYAPQSMIEVSRVVEVPEVINLSLPIDRATLQRICQGLFVRSLEICSRALDEIDLEPTDVTALVATGGISRIPFIRSGLEQFFDREIKEEISPDQAVALGTGIFAARLAKHTVTGVVSGRGLE